jgi:hypothetical protein
VCDVVGSFVMGGGDDTDDDGARLPNPPHSFNHAQQQRPQHNDSGDPDPPPPPPSLQQGPEAVPKCLDACAAEVRISGVEAEEFVLPLSPPLRLPGCQMLTERRGLVITVRADSVGGYMEMP